MVSCFLTFPVKVLASLGSNATLPCRLPSKDKTFFGATGIRVKWTKVADDQAFNQDVVLSMGFHKRTFGSFEDRVFMVNNDNEDGSILITNIAMQDAGKYHCELINGMTDVVQEVYLEVQSSLMNGKYTCTTRSSLIFVRTNLSFVDSNRQTAATCVFHLCPVILESDTCSPDRNCFIFVSQNRCSLSCYSIWFLFFFATVPHVYGVTSGKSGGENGKLLRQEGKETMMTQSSKCCFYPVYRNKKKEGLSINVSFWINSKYIDLYRVFLPQFLSPSCYLCCLVKALCFRTTSVWVVTI